MKPVTRHVVYHPSLGIFAHGRFDSAFSMLFFRLDNTVWRAVRQTLGFPFRAKHLVLPVT